MHSGTNIERLHHDEIARLRARLEEAEGALQMIRSGAMEARDRPDELTPSNMESKSGRLRAEILQHVGDPVVAVDSAEHISYLNAAAERLYAVRGSEVIGHQLDEIYTIRWLDAEQEAAAATALRTAGEWRGECVHLTRDGRELPVESSVSLLTSKDSCISGRVFIQRDISGRKRWEAALQQNARLFSTLVEQAPMGVYVVDSNFQLKQINSQALPAFKDISPLLGRDFEEVLEILWGPEVGLRLAAIFRHTLATGERYSSDSFSETRHDLGEEQAYEWEAQRVTLPDGLHGVVCYFEDVTEPWRAEQALRDSEERTRLATTTAGVGIWEWNLVTNSVRWDAQMFEIHGIPPTPDGFVSYSTWRDAVLPEDLEEQEMQVQEHVRRAVQGRREFRIRRKDDGELRHILAVETVRRNGRGEPEWVVGTNLDVTERKLTEEALHQADRRKNEFLATLAHELRNPLAPLRSGLEIMRMAGDRGAGVTRAREIMERQLGQMVRLVDDLLDVSRITHGKLILRKERVELSAVLNSAVETSRGLIHEMGQQLDLIVPEVPLVLEADFTRLAQVFLNLLNNAAKYSERGGRISVSAERQENEAVVSVRDKGIGISAEQMPHIFELFSQADRSLEKSHGGLGLGLTLVKRLVEMHGGSVEARSGGLGKGSEFFVCLPLATPASEECNPTAEARVAITAAVPGRILVVDDNIDAATTLQLALEIMGYEVATAHDGAEAVAVAAELLPAVILMDIGMPKLNGYDACRRIREQPWGRKMVVIALTGWGQDEDRQKSRDAGFDHHLVKPVDLAVLDKLIGTRLAAAGQ